MYEKKSIRKVTINWKQKYNELKEKYDKLACHVIVNKVKSGGNSYSGNALRVEISITLYPDNIKNKLSYDDFIKNLTSERIKNEFMKLYNRKK